MYDTTTIANIRGNNSFFLYIFLVMNLGSLYHNSPGRRRVGVNTYTTEAQKAHKDVGPATNLSPVVSNGTENNNLGL